MNNEFPTPAEINAHLNEYVVGQEDAKRVLSVAVYNHYKRILYAATQGGAGGIELGKSNILMIGPTGCGKTYITSTVAKMLNVPFAMADATELIASGSVGKSIETVISKLIQNAGFNVALAEQGIIYIDEIDKLSSRGHNSSLGQGVQQQLLKIIEGTIVSIPTQQGVVQINTSNILFIVGGAFVGLELIVQSRLGEFSHFREAGELLADIATDDIVRFGLIPEFVGRLPIIVLLHALDRGALVEALTRPKNALVEQYKKMFAIDGIELIFEKGSIEKIADMALELKTGARGLRTVMEKAMLDIMYKVPNEKNLSQVIITPEVITKQSKPILEYMETFEEVELEPLPPKQPKDLL